MKTTEHYDRVKRFMELAGQETPAYPAIPSEEVRKLRANLIMEEAAETVAALGFTVEYSFKPDPDKKLDLVEIIDGCCDLSVVNEGTLIACGVPDRPFLEEVDQNNLDKIEKGTTREDGKLIKPPDHRPPDIRSILVRLQTEELIKPKGLKKKSEGPRPWCPEIAQKMNEVLDATGGTPVLFDVPDKENELE